ncbi:MAG TPA: membrane biogenesis protein [Nanoarchaeota archaeon]|nr:membrane biogenesis protein [Candidatus Woesearchaeota archaeon]HIH15576.1 membrane biogenesis protein [Nanoarchaeota archaeon]HIH59093.1 membrane biogenesis protein [Nanoarchaeota archaeon]HII14619.1 membrane biogenesis protein [Nanoarchaeota archaeon]HIJ05438.1 membrane biogenesis protein [Nanoarchaeota archaeon]
MLINDSYTDKFPKKKTIFGMIHLAGEDPVAQALKEIALYQEEGVDAAIIENYHGSIADVLQTLRSLPKDLTIKIGVNILPNEYFYSFRLAEEYHLDFIQLDYVAGKYKGHAPLKLRDYSAYKLSHPHIAVLGGVWPKYYTLLEGSRLEDDVSEGMTRAEAIVVTGEGTGKETPLTKIQDFRKLLGKHPLLIGAGLSLENATMQLAFAYGAIVGSAFKFHNETEEAVDKKRVHDLMEIVRAF